MEDTEAAANGELSVAAGHCAEEAVAVPVRRVGETEARGDVAAAPEAIVDEVVALLRRADVLVAGTKVQNEVIRRTPVVLCVHVLFAEPVLQLCRAERLCIRVHAAGPEGGDGRSVVHALAGCRKAPE